MPLSTPFSLFTGYSAPAKEVKASSEDLMKVKRPFYKDLFPSGYQAPSQKQKSIFRKHGKSQTSSLRHFLSIRFANRFFTDNTPKVVERSPATLQYFCIFFLRLVMSRAAEPELGILPGTSAGAQIKNQKEPETKLKMRRSRSSV